VVIENERRGLPCEVILWSAPQDRRRLWRAEFERGFCAEKLKDVVRRLTDAGWRCQPTQAPPSERWPGGGSHLLPLIPLRLFLVLGLVAHENHDTGRGAAYDEGTISGDRQ
jgi:hypothetical protein